MHTIYGEFSVECEMKRLPGILIAWEQYHNSQQYYIHTSNLSVNFLVLFAYYIILSVRAADILHTQPMMNVYRHLKCVKSTKNTRTKIVTLILAL